MNDTRETGRSQRVREVSFSALLLAPTLLYPFGRDQGVFAYVGRLILRGGAPYADVMEQKGPLLHYAYALAMGMFGQTEVGVRTFFLLVSTLGALLAAELAERAMGRGARLGAALGYAAVVAQYHTLGHWHSAQAEDLIALLLLAALLALTRLPASRAYSFAAGVCFGLAILAKSTAAIECGCVALVSLWAAWSPRSGRARRIAELTCATSLGALIVIGGALGYLAWRGALDEFLWIQLTHNRAYAQGSVNEPLSITVYAVRYALLGLLAVTFAWRMSDPSRRRVLQAIAAAGAGALLAYVLQQRFFRYHATPVIALVGLMVGGVSTAHAARLAARMSSRHLSRLLTWMTPLAVVIVLSQDPAALGPAFADVLAVTTNQRSLAGVRAERAAGAAERGAYDLLARRIREATGPQDAVLCWGHELLVNFLADRDTPTRFGADVTLVNPALPLAIRESYRREFMSALRRRPPKLVLVFRNDTTPFMQRDSRFMLQTVPELSDFLRTQYSEDRPLHWRGSIVSDFFYARQRVTDTSRSAIVGP